MEKKHKKISSLFADKILSQTKRKRIGLKIILLPILTSNSQWRIQDFPEGAPTPELVRQPIILKNFCQKLHENERIRPRGGGASLTPHWILHSQHHQWRIQEFSNGGTNYSGGSRIFPRRGRQLSGGGAPTYDFAKFSQKLHEIERIWTPRGGARPKFYYVDPPLNYKEAIFRNFPKIHQWSHSDTK